jgi:hypothetical protein
MIMIQKLIKKKKGKKMKQSYENLLLDDSNMRTVVFSSFFFLFYIEKKIYSDQFWVEYITVKRPFLSLFYPSLSFFDPKRCS